VTAANEEARKTALERVRVSLRRLDEMGGEPTAKDFQRVVFDVPAALYEAEARGELRTAERFRYLIEEAEARGCHGTGYKPGSPAPGFPPEPCPCEARGRAAAALSDDGWMEHCEAAANQARAEGRAAGLEEAAKTLEKHTKAKTPSYGGTPIPKYVAEIRALIAPGGKP
jgi:hypothetical protein